MSGPAQRFTNRVSNYAKYRPGYPQQVLQLLKEHGNLNAGSVVADIGSGTGIFTKLLLAEGYIVDAVEPNDAMQAAADYELGKNKNYRAVKGTAEITTLNNHNIDMVVCAQAFHWFDARQCQAEFARILKPGGKVALIWNNRQTETDEFAVDYELLLQSQASDYKLVNHQNLNEANFSAFFKRGKYVLAEFPNVQLFDEAGLIGRAFSSSYVPAEDTLEGVAFLDKLIEIFKRYQEHGTVAMQYQTEVYIGKV